MSQVHEKANFHQEPHSALSIRSICHQLYLVPDLCGNRAEPHHANSQSQKAGFLAFRFNFMHHCHPGLVQSATSCSSMHGFYAHPVTDDSYSISMDGSGTVISIHGYLDIQLHALCSGILHGNSHVPCGCRDTAEYWPSYPMPSQ